MDDEREKLWDLLDDSHVCMLVDRFQSGMRARPMGMHVDDEAGLIWFITDVDSAKVDEVQANPSVCIAVQTGTTYISVSGAAAVVDDRAKLKDLWNIAVDAWYPEGPDDPNITLLKVTPELGEYWDGPSKIVAGVRMLIASATDERPEMGDNAQVRFT